MSKENRILSVPAANETPAFGAGQAPEKRRQILSGAREVFLERGFDAASMGDIARAAGVSKGTLYVYFEDKVDLFAALVTTECEETAERLFVLDAKEPDLAAALKKLGMSFLEAMLRPEHVATVRMVIATAEKFPEIGRRFLDAGPNSGVRRLSTFLSAKVAQGELDIDDVDSAASQFLSLSKDTILAPVLFGSAATISRDHMEKTVERAVNLFLRVYGARRND
ncbi:putative transcription regulator protein [Azorhizobium caulinodans ORS 571]|uniref:Putative transcription regulator protein n=1 Tax=Azorhizobium caulinodans (strain ATCC 43989 / DSM 5975 / JCM 20966 / LMG 6465 / NBRC 14845 / NCIMB 13405 / ORS 571) TaxID=438753 RepID=A8HWS6_AZOC5|nr:TetR family transcriptional regulator [Azorhizobium sp. AG788]BAF90463.1 putative transcription regulator protein [Azorhizobium caulinodans ORS 571]